MTSRQSAVSRICVDVWLCAKVRLKVKKFGFFPNFFTLE